MKVMKNDQPRIYTEIKDQSAKLQVLRCDEGKSLTTDISILPPLPKGERDGVRGEIMRKIKDITRQDGQDKGLMHPQMTQITQMA
ncbi:MAG: hypothetical protein ACE5D4_09175 [Thermodesulfobacteriota bacterium]